MTDPLERVEQALAGMTPGPFTAYRMVHVDTGQPLSVEEIAEYVKNTVLKSREESGSADFFFVSAQKEDGGADVAHTGNGPTSWPNAQGIATLRNDVPALVDEVKRLRAFVEYYACCRCCEEMRECLPGCTYEHDAHADAYEEMQQAREALNPKETT